MRTPLILLFAFVFSFVFFQNAHATHLLGADLQYECIGASQYSVTLTLYRDCNGVSPSSSQSLSYSSAICGVNGSIQLAEQGSPLDITPLCASEPSACGGSGNYGIQEWTYSGILNLPPSCGNDWIIGWSNCCRNNAINTLNSPGSQDMYVGAILDNTLNPICNSSPSFNNSPGSILCINQPVVYNHGVSDIDGDSIYFSIGSCYQANGTSVNYGTGFNGISPLITASGVNINSITGALSFTPTAQQVGVLCVNVKEFRNGLLIGEINRDMQFTVIACSNTPPQASGVNGTSNTLPVNFQTSICANNELCFNIDGSDANANNVTMSWNGEILGATFVVSNNGTTNPSAQFCWNPGSNDVGQNIFTVNVEDDACPIIGQGTYTYIIDVLPSPNQLDAGQNDSICFGESAILLASSSPQAISYTWSPPSGLISTNGASVTAAPLTTTTYSVNATFPDGCDLSDNVTIYITPNPNLTVSPSNSFNCSGQNSLITANSPTAISFLWSPGGEITSSINVSPSNSSTYSVTATDSRGCSSTANASLTIAAPTGNVCNVLYVTPNGSPSAIGSKADPMDLETALETGACNGTVVKMAVGTYFTDSTINKVTSYITLEGGFDPSLNWDKLSTAGATRILRTATLSSTLVSQGITDEAGASPRVIALEVTGQTGFRFQDITIEVEDLTGSPKPGNNAVSSYGVYLNTCDNYQIIRTQVFAGNASVGLDGSNGSNGNIGINGNGGSGGSCDGGDCTFGNGEAGGFGGNGGNGGGGLQGGAGGAANNGAQNNGSIGAAPVGRNGGSGAGGGAGGDECSNNNAGFGNSGGGFGGGTAGNPGNQGDPGGDGTNGGNGSNGAVGTAGAAGVPGNIIGNYFSPGGQAGTGTSGLGGFGGGSGGGGGRQNCTLFCDNGPGSGGGGGGGGGQGGLGGTGGRGGGSSYGIFILNNGSNGIIDQSNISAGSAGIGGNGGGGGSGGSGGSGGNGASSCSGEIGEGGDGGNGGNGGNGGIGGNGSSGQSINMFLVSGITLNSSNGNFNLAAQPSIRMNDIACTASNTDFFNAISGNWNFGNGSSPSTATGSTVTSQYNNLGRKDIQYNGSNYVGFNNIILDALILPAFTTSAPFIQGQYRICAGESVDFQSTNGGVGYQYNWDLGGGAVPNNYVGATFASLAGITFNTPGVYTIELMYETNCCGLSSPSNLDLYVEEQPTIVMPADVNTCLDTYTPVSLTVSGGTTNGSISWAPSGGLDSSNSFTVNALPTDSTTYVVSLLDSTGLCSSTDEINVNIIDLELSATATNTTCGPDGTAAISVIGGSGNYAYAWNDPGAQTTATASGLAIGNYIVTVSDLTLGCIDSVLVTINPNAGTLVGFISNSTSVSCPGNADGSATITVLGGIPPYNYLWSPIGGNTPSSALTTNTTNPLAGGTYDVLVTDNVGCTYSTSAFIAEPDTLLITEDSLYNPTCLGASDGYINIDVDQGVGPYTIIWDNINNQQGYILDSVGVGTYCVQVIDDNGCIDSMCFVLTAPQLVDTIIDTICLFEPYVLPDGEIINPIADTSVIDTFTNLLACDSFVYTFLSVNPSYEFNIDSILCAGQNFAAPNGSLFTPFQDTSFIDSFLTVSGCDSLYNINLIVQQLSAENIDTTICQGQSLTINGQVYNNSGTYLDTAVYGNTGCDSLHYVINLQIDSFVTELIDSTVCQGQNLTVNGVTYTSTGLYNDTVSYTSSGCDSIQYVINLQVDSFVIENIDTTICQGQSIAVNGFNYNSSGLYNDTVNYLGSTCDSIQYIINLRVDSFTVQNIDTSICDGESISVNGVSYTSSGLFRDTAYYNSSACDSILYVINLQIDSLITENIDTTLCEGQSININGFVYNTTGVYNDTLRYANSGCDSALFVINLQIDSVTVQNLDSTVCQGDSILVNGSSYDATGIYVDTSYKANGCIDEIFIIDLSVSSLPIVVANSSDSDNADCVYNTMNLFGSGTPGVNYFWNNGIINDVAFNPSLGQTNYIVTGIDALGCIDQDTISITGLPTYADTINATICDDENYILPNGASVNTAGSYPITLSSVNNCDSTILTILDVNFAGNFQALDDIIVCDGLSQSALILSDNMISFEWFVDSSLGNQSLIGSPNYLGANTNELSFNLDLNLHLNAYTVQMIDECGNAFSESFTLEVYAPQPTANPLVDTTICLHELNPITIDYNGRDYTWSNGVFGPSISPDESGEYIVNFIENRTNCLLSDTINISLEDCIDNCVILAPTGFSPNANGTNDLFRVVTTCDEGFSAFQFDIYNKWGELIFSTDDWREGWDGNYKGRKAEIGTYTYYVEYNKALINKKEILKGTVTLIR